MNERDAEKLKEVPLTSQFNNFLFDENLDSNNISEAVIELLTPDKYLEFLEIAIEQNIVDDPYIFKAIQRFATHTTVDFIDPLTPDDELPKRVTAVDTEISKFIEDCQKYPSIGLLNKEQLGLIKEVYNSNNLLAFSKDVIQRSNGELSEDNYYMIFRYRNVLKQIRDQDDIILKAEIAEASIKDPKIGARTWGGDIHEYGCLTDGRIYDDEYATFHGKKDDLGQEVVHISGVEIVLSRIKTYDF